VNCQIAGNAAVSDTAEVVLTSGKRTAVIKIPLR